MKPSEFENSVIINYRKMDLHNDIFTNVNTFAKAIIETFERTRGREQFEYGFSIVDGMRLKIRRYCVGNKRFYDVKLKNTWSKLVDVMEVIK